MEGEVIDHTSRLEENLLIQILTLQNSYASAVRCSKLSRRWRDLYTQLPSLNFSMADLLGPDSLIGSPRYAVKLYNYIVTIALCRHKAPIQSIDFQNIRCSSLKNPLNPWLRQVSSPSLRHVSISMDGLCPEYTPPHELLACPNLTTFSISSQPYQNEFSLSQQLPEFRSLKTCRFNHIVITDVSWVKSLLLNAPQLETLHFTTCWFYEVPQFSSQSVRDLNLQNIDVEPLKVEFNCPNIFDLEIPYHIEINNISSVRILKLHDVPRPSRDLWDRLIKLTNLASLTLDFRNPEYGGVLREGNSVGELQKLKNLYIIIDVFGNKERWFLSKVIDRCPKLEVVTIEYDFYERREAQEPCFSFIEDIELNHPSIQVTRNGDNPSGSIILVM